MPIYSGSGSFGVYDYTAVVQTGYIVGSASVGGTADILDIYSTGHWAGGTWMEIDLVTPYYGQGVIRYRVTMPRGGYASVTEVESIGHEIPAGATALTVVDNTLIGSGTNAGLDVNRSTIRMSNSTYMQTFAIIKVGMSGSSSSRLYDNATSRTAVADYARPNGAAIHFRTVSIAGHPYRRT